MSNSIGPDRESSWTADLDSSCGLSRLCTAVVLLSLFSGSGCTGSKPGDTGNQQSDGGDEGTEQKSGGESDSDADSGVSISTPELDEGGEVGGDSDDDGDDSGNEGVDVDTPRFDFSIPDAEMQCPGGDGYDFSVIWIANSEQGTVSKIDTKSAVEIARYRTGPRADTDPSRTSVNLQGSVAVANRTGSVTKIAAVVDHCVDNNGDGMIRTSQGPNDLLAWGEDECVLWHHDLGYTPTGAVNDGGPRGLAWDAGTENPDDPCADTRPNVWVGWRDQPTGASIVRRIDTDGNMDDEVRIDNFVGNWGHGIYGGASDRDGNFWGLGTYISAGGGQQPTGTLVKIDAVTMEVTRYPAPGVVVMYGMALDAEGNPWATQYSSPARLFQFDLATEKWIDHGSPPGSPAPSVLRGMMIDRSHQAWVAANNFCGVSQFDTKEKRWVNGLIPLAGCLEPVGISIDSEEFVWVVDREAALAYKVDPVSHDAVTVEGLVRPYTYSDMTGAGLKLQVDPPAR